MRRSRTAILAAIILLAAAPALAIIQAYSIRTEAGEPQAFPTTPVLDDFNRANQGPPPSADWGNVTNGIEVYSNMAKGDVAGADNISYWLASTFGPDFEVYATWVSGTSADYCVLYFLNFAGNDGYALVVSGVSGSRYYQIIRVDDGAPAPLTGQISHTPAAGDAYGLSRVNDTITAYHKPAGGAWAELTHVSDATYSAPGNLVVNIYGTNIRLDDFGGGTP